MISKEQMLKCAREFREGMPMLIARARAAEWALESAMFPREPYGHRPNNKAAASEFGDADYSAESRAWILGLIVADIKKIETETLVSPPQPATSAVDDLVKAAEKYLDANDVAVTADQYKAKYGQEESLGEDETFRNMMLNLRSALAAVRAEQVKAIPETGTIAVSGCNIVNDRPSAPANRDAAVAEFLKDTGNTNAYYWTFADWLDARGFFGGKISPESIECSQCNQPRDPDFGDFLCSLCKTANEQFAAPASWPPEVLRLRDAAKGVQRLTVETSNGNATIRISALIEITQALSAASEILDKPPVGAGASVAQAMPEEVRQAFEYCEKVERLYVGGNSPGWVFNSMFKDFREAMVKARPFFAPSPAAANPSPEKSNG